MSTPDYYCHPLFHNKPIWGATTTGYWLVTCPDALAPGPGVYTSWDVCSSVCEGVSGAGGTFYATQADCYAAWHTRCRLGEHSHPAEPQTPNCAAEYPENDPLIFKDLHFVVRGGEAIYSSKDSAFTHYQKSIKEDGSAELLATRNYMKALYFARGANEWTAERFARETSPAEQNQAIVPASPHPGGGISYPFSPACAAPPAADSANEGKALESQRQQQRANRLAAIQAGLEAGRLEQEKKSRHLEVINNYISSLPKQAQGSTSKVLPYHLPPSPSYQPPPSPATPSKCLTPFTLSKGFTPKASSASKRQPTIVIRKMGKGKVPAAAADGTDSDTLYEDLDENLAEVLADYVDPDYRFDPRFENQLGNDA
ncbi:hypothetical protein B0H16DRAFT_1745052 [Mycena metata]|uniref:Uncharacterized protein n=1 Tax=Mycena metata TaxID=1033252 RepID=A0AAD7H3S7_9AGAR|nr:hypothetical protein B0H16DRAFT_1745052 [Mycena metata]